MVFKVDLVQFGNYFYLSTPPNHAQNGKKNKSGKRQRLACLQLCTTNRQQVGIYLGQLGM
jgi:hypothetical protein